MIRSRHIVRLHIAAGVQPHADKRDAPLPFHQPQQLCPQLHRLFQCGRCVAAIPHPIGEAGVLHHHGGINAHGVRLQIAQRLRRADVLLRIAARQAGHHLQPQRNIICMNQRGGTAHIGGGMPPLVLPQHPVAHTLRAQLHRRHAIAFQPFQRGGVDRVRAGGQTDAAEHPRLYKRKRRLQQRGLHRRIHRRKAAAEKSDLAVRRGGMHGVHRPAASRGDGIRCQLLCLSADHPLVAKAASMGAALVRHKQRHIGVAGAAWLSRAGHSPSGAALRARLAAPPLFCCAPARYRSHWSSGAPPP